jgi:peptidoglycan/xylan/chitin deacetylase (PgdA/CDA1 family)
MLRGQVNTVYEVKSPPFKQDYAMTPKHDTLSTAKGLIRSGVALAYYLTGRHKRANLGQFIILMYHRVIDDNDPYIPFIQPGMYVRLSSFNDQLEFLAENYEIVSIKDMLNLIETNHVAKDRQYCVITFDDGWLDNYQHAFPILKKFSAPATIFLAESFIGTNRFFWHEKISKLFYLSRSKLKNSSLPIESRNRQATDALGLLRNLIFSAGHPTPAIDATIEAMKSLPISTIENAIDNLADELDIPFANERTMLNWAEIAEMGKNNISFGSHTCGHQILTNLNLQDATLEINGSMEKLKSKELNFVPIFCYPNGRYNDQIRSLVIDAGYSAAVTTKLGRESGELRDPFGILRIGIHDDIANTKPLFSYRLR